MVHLFNNTLYLMSKWWLSLRVIQLCPWCSFNTETFCVLELYKSTATWSLMCIYIYFSYIKNSYLRVNKSEVPWNVVIGVMFSTRILKLSSMVVWRIIYNLAVHSYWSLCYFSFWWGGGRDSNFFYYETIIYSGHLQSFMSMLMIFSSDESKRRT